MLRSSSIPLPKGWPRHVRNVVSPSRNPATVRRVREDGRIAVVEQFIQSFKNECTRAILVPFHRDAFQRELEEYAAWFNAYRPQSFLAGATPDEIYFETMPANRKPRFEPRPHWPWRSVCARPQAFVRGRPGAVVELRVEHRSGRKHLPRVSLERAA